MDLHHLATKVSEGQLKPGVEKSDNSHSYLKTIIQRRQNLRETLMNYQKTIQGTFLFGLKTSVRANMKV